MKKNDDKQLTNGMTWLYLLLTIGMGAAIFANVISIQWVNGDDWRLRGEKSEADFHDEPARRGDIISSDGHVLATTVTECDLYLELRNSPAKDKNGNVKMKDNDTIFAGPIVDSNYNKYLDTICLMLHRAFPERSVEYYHTRIDTERKKEKPSRCFLVQRKVPYSVWNDISRFPGWSNGVVKSVNMQPVARQMRAHIYGNMAENTLGFQNDLKLGTYTGLEGYYDSILRGVDGKYYRHRLTRSIWLDEDPAMKGEVAYRTDDGLYDTVVVNRRIDGNSIVATLDTRYQDIAESSLRRALFKYNATAGCAILMEVETGYVLACANLAVDTSVHNYREVRDRNVAVSDIYPPGSTFKSVALAAMLSDPGIKVDTAQQFFVGVKNYGKDGLIEDDHRVRGADGKVRDSLNVREIIEQSSNVGMVEMGWHFYRVPRRSDTLRIIMNRIFPYEKLNPDLNERQPRAAILTDMKPVSNFTRLCFGYSTAITPLQLATFYNAIAGNGRMMKPLFCRAIIDIDGHRTDIKPQVLNEQVISTATAKMLRSMLTGVVNNGGTGKGIKSDTYTLAGKTGTAKDNRRSGTLYHASFAGFFPAEQPRYTCVVLLEGCHQKTYGSQAAPVFKEIADCVMAIDKRMGNAVTRKTDDNEETKVDMEPPLTRGNQSDLMALYKRLKLPYLSADSASTWVTYRTATDSTPAQYVGYAPAEGRVPNCIGMTAKDAVAILESYGYRAKVVGFGRVRSQTPRGGQTLKHGARVEVVLR